MADEDQLSDITAAEVQQETPAPNLLWGIIAHPVPTLIYLRDHPQRIWLAPLILAILLIVAQGLVTAPIAAQMAADRMEEQLAQMPAEQRAQLEGRLAQGPNPTLLAGTALITGLIGLMVRWLFRAGVIHLFSLGLGGRSRFNQVFSMVAWTWMPFLIRSLLQTLNIAFSGTLPTYRGLSAYLAAIGYPLPTGTQYALLSRVELDLFVLWNLALLGLGVLIVTGLPRIKALLVTGGYWVLATGLSLIPVLAGQFFLTRFPMLGGAGG